MPKTNNDPETMLQDAVNAIHAAYNAKVRVDAEDFAKRIAAREWDSREAFNDAFHEETDGDGWIIYTMKAKCILLASDNEDAYADEFGEPAPTVEAAALMAYQRDLTEALDRLGVDLNDDATFEAPEPEDDPAGDIARESL